MSTCGTCHYLDTLDSMNPSAKVKAVIDGLRTEHVCKPKHEARKPHPLTMAGK